MKYMEITRAFMWGSTRYTPGMKGNFADHVAAAIVKRQLGKEVSETQSETPLDEGYERKDMQAEKAPQPTPRRRTYKRRDRVAKE